MDDLPELPFEQVLSYLSLKDRLKARAVAKRWYHKINSFKLKSLCYSSRSSDFILGKSRWVSGAFAKNFIGSTRFISFFDTYSQTILSNLKHLRLCDLDLHRNETAFARTLNSFSQLKELDIIDVYVTRQDVLLNLPMLSSLQLEDVNGIEKLTLDAPRLREVKIQNCFSYEGYLRVEFVHGESVKRLLVYSLECTKVKKLKNLQFLYIKNLPEIDSTFLSSLQQLKEIHLQCALSNQGVRELFEQKQRSGRADLKIYLSGLLLNGPHDPAMNALRDSSLNYLSREWIACLAENPSRLADEIPFYRHLHYLEIEERVAPGIEADLLKRFTDLNEYRAFGPVQDIERFLGLLKNCENFVMLKFYGDQPQPQDLFNRLPEHCAVQELFIYNPPSDLAFLFRLKHLIHLYIDWAIDSETVRRAFDELPALSKFEFGFGQKRVSIETGHSKQFEVWVDYIEKTSVADMNAAFEFIVESGSL